MSMNSKDITAVLQDWNRGDPEALAKLLPLVVDDLRRAAHHYFQWEDADQTLQPTALVNEVCLRLMGWRKVSWENRAQFFSFAGKLMRQLLIDFARTRKAAKRGGDIEMVSLTAAIDPPARPSLDPDALLGLHTALERLERLDAQASRVVELRYFVGLGIKETAAALALSPATVKRDWAMAKHWLARELGGGKPFAPS